MTKIHLKSTWLLSKQIGQGGFAKVHEGQSEEGRPVAIKFIPKAAGAARELLFEDLAGVRGIVPILDTGEDTLNWILVMPRAEKSLKDHLALNKQLPHEEVLKIVRDVASALAAIEGRVLHRDIKPGNILLLGNTWCLADFGISRFVEATTSSETNHDRWTSAYNPPERWRNERAVPASDIYSLGVVMYEMLSGKLPFPGPNFREQHLTQNAPPLTNVPVPLASLVMECLLKAPGSRPRAETLLNRMKGVETPAATGLVKLQQAQQAQIQIEAARSAHESMLRDEAERRRSLFMAASQVWGAIAGQLVKTIETHAPSAKVHKTGKGELPIEVVFGQSLLSLSNSNPVNKSPWRGNDVPFDVIAVAAIDLKSPTSRNYGGRSHSLWYCDAKTSGEFAWFETAFMMNGFFSRLSVQEPFALPPSVEAEQAVGPMFGQYQVAWPFNPLTTGTSVDEFVARWAEWLADASQGKLTRPSTMPEKEVGGTWRRQ